jgi:hypothetical protein
MNGRSAIQRLPFDDARRVLGFSELENGTYEALQRRRESERVQSVVPEDLSKRGHDQGGPRLIGL